jgi:subtilase family serine protease
MSLHKRQISNRRRAARLAIIALAASTVWVSAQDPGRSTYTADPPRKMMISSAAGVRQAFPTPSQCVAAFGLACYTPALMRKAYNVPPAWTGLGQTIVIVDAYGSPTVREDLQTFSELFGLPDADLQIVYPGGSPTFNPLQHHDEAGWAFETSLDVQWAHAIAPDAKIVLVVGANNAGNVLVNAQRFVVDHHLGDVMSLSFGADEALLKGDGANNLQINQAHDVYLAAQAAGITVFASSGDGGASDGFPFANASYPASDPLVTGVGGTNLFMTDAGAYVGETVWNDSDGTLCPFGCTQGLFGATGGAPSSQFATPLFQAPLIRSSVRLTGDVAYDAGVYTGVLVNVSFFSDPNANGLYFVGGTSAGAPQWAAIAAIINQATGKKQGYLNPALYAIAGNAAKYAQAFHDVTVGNNAFFGPGFPAGAKYDLPTGLGSPRVNGLIDALK